MQDIKIGENTVNTSHILIYHAHTRNYSTNIQTMYLRVEINAMNSFTFTILLGIGLKDQPMHDVFSEYFPHVRDEHHNFHQRTLEEETEGRFFHCIFLHGDVVRSSSFAWFTTGLSGVDDQEVVIVVYGHH